MTELILENFLAAYEPEEVVALLSAFVFQERRSETDPTLTPHLQEGRKRMNDIVDRVTAVQVARRADVAESGSDSNILNFGLSEVVYEWAKGMVRTCIVQLAARIMLELTLWLSCSQPFDEITNLTDVQEGTIVRSITRLDECCREVRDAARVIGDAALYQKMEAAQACIKRDIVLCVNQPISYIENPH